MRRDATGDVFYYSQDMLGSSVAMVEVPAGQTTAAVCHDALEMRELVLEVSRDG